MKNDEVMAVCPHCGGDVFTVSESEVRRVRFLASSEYPFCREDVLASEGKGWDGVVCDGCGRDIDPRDVLAQIDGRREDIA